MEKDLLERNTLAYRPHGEKCFIALTPENCIKAKCCESKATIANQASSVSYFNKL
jgi:hypothetical protein